MQKMLARQTLRSGTNIENSNLPFMVWYRTIGPRHGTSVALVLAGGSKTKSNAMMLEKSTILQNLDTAKTDKHC